MAPDYETLLDELARVFAEAAVDRYLREMTAQNETPPEARLSEGAIPTQHPSPTED